MKNKKIAIIGSCADQQEFDQNKTLCRELGNFLGAKKVDVLFSIENDIMSIPAMVAKHARKAGAKTIGFTHGEETTDKFGISDEIIITFAKRGGPREFLLMSNADLVVGIGGGSGTLMEIAIAYQLGKKVILFEETGGWCDKLEVGFLDGRERVKISKVNGIEQLGELF